MMRWQLTNLLWQGGTALMLLFPAACHRRPLPCPDSLPAYSQDDQPYIEKAYAYEYGHGDYIDPHYSREQILRDVYPVILNFRTAKCVGLYPRRSGIPRSPTMCFEKGTGKLVLTYNEDMIQEGPAPKLP